MEDRFHLNNLKEYAHLNRFMEYNRIEFVDLTEDQCILKHETNEESRNINGIAHGGILFTMVDIAASTLVRKGGTNCSTANVSINYFRPGNGTIYAKAEFLKRGRRLNVVHSWCYGENNEVICDAVVTLCLID